MQAKGGPRYLTSVEVAAACGVSSRTVSNWIRDGSIPAHRTLGGHARVSSEDLLCFLSARKIPVPPHLLNVSPEPEARAPRARILLIDYDEALLEVMKEKLEASGYEVHTARHGFLAGYLLAHHPPDLILLDILMPGLDGYEVLSLVRRRPDAREIPVVACTSLKGAETEARLRAAGFDGYVPKPIDFGALKRTLGSLVS